ncbi:hypothetical protein BGS_1337 [Beggiatoa sp. SS]|nr:hypothetical protein BGS_1337 [Beggiatoa sp. SS]
MRGLEQISYLEIGKTYPLGPVLKLSKIIQIGEKPSLP